MLCWELRSYAEAAAQSSYVLMDRGVPDVIGYLTLCGLPVPAHAERAAELHRYSTTVFLAPDWDAIFTQDEERKQNDDEARATSKVMAQTYSRMGYSIVELPFVGIEDRTDFLMKHISAPPLKLALPAFPLRAIGANSQIYQLISELDKSAGFRRHVPTARPDDADQYRASNVRDCLEQRNCLRRSYRRNPADPVRDGILCAGHVGLFASRTLHVLARINSRLPKGSHRAK